MKKAMRFSLPALLLSAVIASPGNTKVQDDSIKLRADLVLIEAQVIRKKTGSAVQGLSKGDFVLYEDNVEQYITHFSQDKLPLSMVILLDVTGSIAPMIEGLRSAAAQSLARLKPVDQVALMAFGGSTRVAQDLTTDKQLVARTLEETDGTGIERGTIINLGVLDAASYLQTHSNPQSRRVILAITDDVSTQKSPSPGEGSTLRKLHDSGSVVCGLVFFNPLKQSLRSFTPGSIKTYAIETGGTVINVDKKSLPKKLDELVERLRSSYSLGFTSSNEKSDGSFRKIRLELSPPARQREGESQVQARKGYNRNKQR